MSVNHNHNHGSIASTNINKAFYIGITLNLLFVGIEAAAGFFTNSLALLGDAGHNLSDVFSLALSLFAIMLLKVKRNDKYTYGYRKATILTALVNAVILIIAVAIIGYEAIMRLRHVQPVEGKSVIIVASIGIVINFVTAMLFMKNKEKDLNVKSAYLHLMADAIVSVGVVISGVIILYTGWYWIDSVISLVIVVVILFGTWELLTDSLRLTLDGVPDNVDIDKVKTLFSNISDIKNVHHIHVWALSTSENALTAHVTISDNTSLADIERIKNNVKHELEHQNIQHATLEFEAETVQCKTSNL